MLFVSSENHRFRSPIRVLVGAAVISMLASACASEDQLSGTWRDPDGTTQLPPDLGGGLLGVDATLELDGTVEPATFDLHLLLTLEGLSDTVDAYGTYEETGADLTLNFEGFTIDPASGNTTNVADDGSQCIVLQGFGGGAVCFPVPQTNGYTVASDTLTMIIDQAIAGAPVSETNLAFERVE